MSAVRDTVRPDDRRPAVELATAARAGAIDCNLVDAALVEASRSGKADSASALALYREALLELALSDPPVGADAALTLLAALAPISGAWLFVADGDGEELRLAAGSGSEEPSQHVVEAARRALKGAPDATGALGVGTLQGVRMARPETGALVVRVRSPRDANACTEYLTLTARTLEVLRERESSRERDAERAAAVEATERRLVRLAYDLHDGALQEVVALASDLRLFRSQLANVVDDAHREIVFGRVDDLDARLVELERELRELAQSLEARSLVEKPFEDVARDEVDTFRERSGISVSLRLDGSFDAASVSQRLALIRILQEALANVREHSGARHVAISIVEGSDGVRLIVADDGCGFDVDEAFRAADEGGRLGLSGMNERVRLLGGTFAVESRPGGPTTISALLPRWSPSGLST